ncbi:MCE family protein [Actinocorallia sp. API 0066]|uniref:MCE family protein n=1 Tax=Actinocorallia sp. API 0066 TaxID=2896846 RepID=UPI001E50B236|nr:MCE family protein [Actinocorallia sp. API 0066]MCD0449363.1 MCE family protein [Actinocorallia sp. API 0066]
MRLIAACGVLMLTATVGGCEAVPLPGESPYRMSAYFAKAPSLYPESKVKVMGADVGSVTAVRIDGARVRVDLTIDADVPLPADVWASIEAVETLGERSVVLSPAWEPGMPKAAPGAVVPQERTTLPVEIDEALEAFTRLESAIDPGKLGALLHEGAQALDGNGMRINDAVGLTADLVNDLAGQDQKLVRIAERLRDLAADLNGEDLDTILAAFASTSGTLAQERARLQAFITGLADTIRKSGVLITAYQETLPATAADLSNIVMTLKAGSDSINQVITSLSRFADVIVNAWDRENHVAVIRIQLSATVRIWLQPIFDAMGWGRVPCPRDNTELADCPPPKKKAP